MDAKPNLILYFLTLSAVFLSVIQIIMINIDLNYGLRLEIMSRDIENNEFENDVLSKKIASASSIMALSSKAKIIGLIDQTKSISLNSPLPIAQLK